ncbi:BPSL0067_family protein [Hexamita inflata]|uniref:BPSL0067 family protein n=1 Tax=Hexamita inflata TaxID=28002 RepID=A0AA86U799_9EUKA|nr:BPSL0067 family protein [Hexamita inflata]
MVVFSFILNYVANLDPIIEAAHQNLWCPTNQVHDSQTLVKQWTGKQPSEWKRGVQVKGKSLQNGTCIASFVYNPAFGYYYNESLGAHAAIYVGQTYQGIIVYDQWNTQPCHKRTISFKGDGSLKNDGDQFFVIE